jgi:anti-sigma regulatory factor (Ser/Thr protein kinase)
MSEPETLPPGPGVTVIESPVPWDSDGVARARVGVRRSLALADLPETLRRHAELVASELVTNAVRHGSPPLRMTVLTVGRGVRIEVRDASPLPPATLLTSPPTAEGGRGLGIVGALSSRWGHYQEGTGKCVWSELEPAPIG